MDDGGVVHNKLNEFCDILAAYAVAKLRFTKSSRKRLEKFPEGEWKADLKCHYAMARAERPDIADLHKKIKQTSTEIGLGFAHNGVHRTLISLYVGDGLDIAARFEEPKP